MKVYLKQNNKQKTTPLNCLIFDNTIINIILFSRQRVFWNDFEIHKVFSNFLKCTRPSLHTKQSNNDVNALAPEKVINILDNCGFDG